MEKTQGNLHPFAVTIDANVLDFGNFAIPHTTYTTRIVIKFQSNLVDHSVTLFPNVANQDCHDVDVKTRRTITIDSTVQ